MLRPARTSLLLALTALALGVAGCDSGERTIPKDDADVLLRELDEIQADVDQGLCTEARTNISQLEGEVFNLPKDVGAQTKDDLRRLVDNLQGLASDATQCPEKPQSDPPPPPDTGATGEFGGG